MPDSVLLESALGRIAEALGATGRYRVARRFEVRSRYAEPDGRPTLRALYVDVESTGLDTAYDTIIQLALVPFEYVPSNGRILVVEEALVQLEDPGRPLPVEITALTGLCDGDLAGRRIDDEAVAALARDASLVIAHNAGFDRPLLERRLPWFRELPWACSQREVPWAAHGVAAAKLEFILWRHAGSSSTGTGRTWMRMPAFTRWPRRSPPGSCRSRCCWSPRAAGRRGSGRSMLPIPPRTR